MADNTHQIVEEKLEAIKEAQEAEEAKKRPPPKLDEYGEEIEEEEPKRKKNVPKLILCTQQTKYRVVKKSCRRLDYRLSDDVHLDWDLYWSDTGIEPHFI